MRNECYCFYFECKLYSFVVNSTLLWMPSWYANHFVLSGSLQTHWGNGKSWNIPYFVKTGNEHSTKWLEVGAGNGSSSRMYWIQSSSVLLQFQSQSLITSPEEMNMKKPSSSAFNPFSNSPLLADYGLSSSNYVNGMILKNTECIILWIIITFPLFTCLLISSILSPIQCYKAFLLAVHYAQRSGEVWCEGARLFLNPSSPYFSLKNAQICLGHAATFSSQCGDVFIEVRTNLFSLASYSTFHISLTTRYSVSKCSLLSFFFVLHLPFTLLRHSLPLPPRHSSRLCFPRFRIHPPSDIVPFRSQITVTAGLR